MVPQEKIRQTNHELVKKIIRLYNAHWFLTYLADGLNNANFRARMETCYLIIEIVDSRRVAGAHSGN